MLPERVTNYTWNACTFLLSTCTLRPVKNIHTAPLSVYKIIFYDGKIIYAPRRASFDGWKNGCSDPALWTYFCLTFLLTRISPAFPLTTRIYGVDVVLTYDRCSCTRDDIIITVGFYERIKKFNNPRSEMRARLRR